MVNRASRGRRPPVSIFNDVIGPVMRGPSSSHCAAALRIGRLARDLMDGEFSEVLVEFDRRGSLPTTHASQGSDMGLCGGLLGWDADDERLPGSPKALREAGIRLDFRTIDAGDPHPNTYRLALRGAGGIHSLRAVSTGGGMIEVIAIDDFAVSMRGDCHVALLWLDGPEGASTRTLRDRLRADEVLCHVSARRRLLEVRTLRPVDDAALRGFPGIRCARRLAPVLPVLSHEGTTVPFTTYREMLRRIRGRPARLWRMAVAYEQARGDLGRAEVIARMAGMVRLLRRSIVAGLAGTRYPDRILGHQCGRFAARMDAGRLLPGGALDRAVLYVTALMEAKSSMGVIVAAPTAGACAALPGAVIATAEAMGLDEEAMAKALLAAGLVGVFIATDWTFAAEVGGCQAECGAAGAMAATALVTLADGTLPQTLAAASMALQNTIGLVCDPVANRVEVPCLGRNVAAAANAFACANMALAGYDPVIPLDETIRAARDAGQRMSRELRCTALGGLSVTPASRAVARRLARAQSVTTRTHRPERR